MWVEFAASTRIPCVVQVASITPPQWSISSAPLTHGEYLKIVDGLLGFFHRVSA